MKHEKLSQKGAANTFEAYIGALAWCGDQIELDTYLRALFSPEVFPTLKKWKKTQESGLDLGPWMDPKLAVRTRKKVNKVVKKVNIPTRLTRKQKKDLRSVERMRMVSDAKKTA